MVPHCLRSPETIQTPLTPQNIFEPPPPMPFWRFQGKNLSKPSKKGNKIEVWSHLLVLTRFSTTF